MSESIDARVNTARAGLEDALDELEDKLDVPKQVEKLKKKVASSYEENPVPWIIGATAAAIVTVGLVAWAVFSDD